MTNLRQFHALMETVQDPVFMECAKIDCLNRREFCTVLDSVEIDLRGRSFLDIGPGYGSTLDIARERGASLIEFVDYNPFMFTFNRLKGFKGYNLDARRHLTRLRSQTYDLIWLKGTFSADRLILVDRFPVLSCVRWYPKLGGLLDQIEQLAAPSGQIVFCPHWQPKNGEWIISDIRKTSLYRTFEDRGYRSLPYIEGHNMGAYPMTFYKRQPADHNLEATLGKRCQS